MRWRRKKWIHLSEVEKKKKKKKQGQCACPPPMNGLSCWAINYLPTTLCCTSVVVDEGGLTESVVNEGDMELEGGIPVFEFFFSVSHLTPEE